jgi:copper oxidase (laccase) domain-containing protein
MAEEENYRNIELQVSRQPRIFREINYLPGQENKAAILPLLEALPIKHVFSWGKDSGNMSPVYAGNESEEVVRARIKGLLESSGIEYKNDANTKGAFEGTHLQMQEVVLEDLTKQPETAFEANFIFTRDPRVVLSIRPGDCNVSIIYCVDKSGREIVGLIHSSAMSANMGLPRYAIQHLIIEEEVDPTTIKIGITPGISSKHYSLNETDYKVKDETFSRTIVEHNWKEHIAKKDPNKPDDQQRPVDIFGATIMQFIEEGIDPSNIEGYDIDTFEAAENGITFSHRESSINKKPEGRYMIAVKLNDRGMAGHI